MMVHGNICIPFYLCFLDGFLMTLDEAQFSLRDPRMFLRPIVCQEEPGNTPHYPQSPEDVENGRPTPKEPRGN